MMGLDIGLDMFPLAAALLSALTCGLLGNFLVLRRISLMGDAISHSVLPGLVLAFLIASTRSPMVMLLGAAVAGVATVVLVEVIKKLGRVEPGAAMGVVFSVMFALGVLLIEQAAVRQVDLDADCVLHGQLETLAWFDAPASVSQLLAIETLVAIPRQVWLLIVMTVLTLGFITLLFKELRIAAFDPALATTQGFSAQGLHYVLMVFVAAATVAAFEAVGSILVIAMLVCPAATARLLTDRLGSQLAWSGAIAIVTAGGGYLIAGPGLAALGHAPVNAAGMMAVAAGAALALVIAVSPRYGLIVRALRRRGLAAQVAMDDLLGALYRASEAGGKHVLRTRIGAELRGRRWQRAAIRAVRRGLIKAEGDALALTPAGRRAAAQVIRRHRLWESYLVGEAGLAPDHVHDRAEQLEHLTVGPRSGPTADPHGKRIP